jgi:glutamate carboxypeptidase
MADLMALRLAALGCTIERYPGGEVGDCIAGTLRGRGVARILLMGHIDTVYPEGTAGQRPLRLEGDRAIGPGACNLKGGLLVGLYALDQLRRIGFDEFAEITFFCSSDEEINSPYSRPCYLPLAARAHAALVLEAGWPKGQLPYGAVTSSRKGGGRLHLHVTGRESHAGTEYERGASAILALARKIDALHGLTGQWPGVTVNAGVIRGGTVSNMVAGQAYADIDLRVGRQQDITPLEEACRTIAAQAHVPGTSARLEGGIVAPPMERSPGVGLLVELAQAEAAKLGFSLAEHASGGTSDASYIAAQGTPVLDGLGPVGAQDHSPDEYLLVDSLAPRIALLSRLMIAISNRSIDLAAVKFNKEHTA